jgi:hypothetical protein
MSGMDSIFDDTEAPEPEPDSCVIEGTLIQTLRGSIPVEWIEIGDLVYSYDFEKSDFGFFKVLGLNVPVEKSVWSTITTALGHKLSCTLDHPIFSDSIESGELPIQDAEVGSPIYVLEEGKLIKDSIESININRSSVVVYNFEVDQVHTYISDNILSHNASTKESSSAPIPEGHPGAHFSGHLYETPGTDDIISGVLSDMITPKHVVVSATDAFGSSGGEFYDPGDPDASSEFDTSTMSVDLSPPMPFGGSVLVDVLNKPTISNVDVRMVSEEGAYQITIECTIYMDEPRAYGFGVTHLAGQLLKGYGGSEVSYFTSTTPSAASAIMNVASTETVPGPDSVIEMEETEVSIAVVGENYWSTANFPPFASFSTDYHYASPLAYPEIEWNQASLHADGSYIVPEKRSTHYPAARWPSVLAFANIDPALINELSTPLTEWQKIANGVQSQFSAAPMASDLEASTIGGIPQSEVLNYLYEAQHEMTSIDGAATVPHVFSETGRQQYTPVVFYFTANINEQQLFDIAEEQIIHLRCWMLNLGLSEYKPGDWARTEVHATLPLDLLSAVKGKMAGQISPATIHVDGASVYSASDLINILNPNSFYINYTLNESYYDDSIASFSNVVKTGRLDPQGQIDLTSTNNYNPGDTRFYRVATQPDLFSELKKVNVAGFDELFSTEYISSITINIDNGGTATICNLPISCTNIEWYAYKKGLLNLRVPGATPQSAAVANGYIEGTKDAAPGTAFVHESVNRKWVGGLFAGSSFGASYLVQFIFKNADGSVLGWFDAIYGSDKIVTDITGIETIGFGVQEVTRNEENITFKIFEAKSGNLSSETIDVIRESSELSLWQGEVDEIKNNTGTVTRYTVNKINDSTGEVTIITGEYSAGDEVVCTLNGISNTGKLRFEFKLKAASLAESSNNTAIETTNPVSSEGRNAEFKYSYLAQEKNWPLIFPGEASPGQTYGLNDYFERLVTNKTVSKTITSTPTIIDPYISTISAERSLIGNCNIIEVQAGGSQDLVNHYILCAEYGGVSAPIQIMIPNFDGKIVFIDSQNFNFYGTIIYSMKIVDSSMQLLTDNDWPTASINRNSSIDLIDSTDGFWGSRSILYSS